LQFVKIFTNLGLVKDPAQQDFYKALGARIRELRGALTQEQLAKAVNLTRTSIVSIEAGRQKLLVHNLFKIAEAVSVRPTELLRPLEPTQGEVPQLKISGNITEPVNQWFRRSVTKAMRSHSPK
jgi:transcriptional regulator with XRE-family HTH domain